MTLLLEQLLNGLQLGLTLFLISAGLTLVFGIMNMLNLAHGSLYMLGAFLCATLLAKTQSFAFAVPGAVVVTMLVAFVLERVVIRFFYHRPHLDQVIATFGLIIFFNEFVRYAWGSVSLFANVPPLLSGSVHVGGGASLPVYRIALVCVGMTVAAVIWWVVARTRSGILVRAVASQPYIMPALGVNTNSLSAAVFVAGAGLAALAGALTAPLYSIEAGIGEPLLIKSFVVLVIGGLGSVLGAFIAALAVGVVDTAGRLLPGLVALPSAFGEAAIYVLMILVLYFRPQGLLGTRRSDG
jgi:branched-chain amino acid transport system permease protein